MATHSVPEVLGGEIVLGRPVNKSGALADLVREGLPVKALLLLAERLNKEQRKAVGWTLLLVGIVTTIPLAMLLLGKRR